MNKILIKLSTLCIVCVSYIGLMSCNDDLKNENEIDLSDPRIQNTQVVCCDVQSPQQNLPWLSDIIKKANNDAKPEYNVGTIWLEEYNGMKIFVTNMKFGSGGIMYHYFDCSGNNLALQMEKEELDSFAENMKLDVVIYSNYYSFFSIE